MKREITIGKFRCILLQGGSFRVDGGAMFGTLPRRIWEKKSGPVRGNCIELPVRSLLVLGPRHRILIDPGIGPREEKRFGRDYAIRREEGLAGQLRRVGITSDEIDIVINTHLHWDHAGANLALAPDGSAVPAFPRAVYLVQQGEWEAACRPDALTKEGYRLQDRPTLIRSGQLELLHGAAEIIPGVSVMMTPGHTPYHQSVRVESEGETLFCPGDLIPAAAHLAPTVLSAYDLEPWRTFTTKKKFLQQVCREGGVLALCHGTQGTSFHRPRVVKPS